MGKQDLKIYEFYMRTESPKLLGLKLIKKSSLRMIGQGDFYSNNIFVILIKTQKCEQMFK